MCSEAVCCPFIKVIVPQVLVVILAMKPAIPEFSFGRVCAYEVN
jgi:hypothetical protein